jgi:poly-gamma-glutamate synthesis protein (capsule biosynthesis protein)
VLQPVERRGGTLVAYGLGDFLGTAWPRVRWPLRIAGLLVVDVATDPARRGEILRHALVPFVRLRDGGGERLVPAGDAPRELRGKVAARLDAVLGPAG